MLHATDTAPQRSSIDAWDLRFETTTYVLDLEKQGLGDDTVANGIGRDTTLIGDSAALTIGFRHRRLYQHPVWP